jgi:hypothetical protein
MDTLIIILAVAAVPLFLSIVAAVFGWRYRRRIEASMRRSIAELHSPPERNAVASGRPGEAPVRAPLRLHHIGPGATPPPDRAMSAWPQIRERQRPLVAAVVTAGAVHAGISVVAVSWAFAFAHWPLKARIVLAYVLTAPELALVLLFIAAPRRVWTIALLGYVVIGVMLVPVAGGPLRLVQYLRFAAPWALFCIVGMALMISKRLRPVVGAIAALLVFFVVEMLLLTIFADVASLQSTMGRRPGLGVIGVVVQLVGILLFAWILGRESIIVPVLSLLVIGGFALLIDRFVKPLGIVSAIVVGIAGAVLGCYIVWLLFKLLKRLGEQRLISNQVLQWYIGWGFLTFYAFTLAYFVSQVDRRPAFLAVGALPSCAIVLQFLLWQYYRRQAGIPAKRLVLLRVFGSPRRAVRLLEMMNDTWRLFGSVDLIVGTDVAALTASPVMLEAFLRRRVEALYLKTTTEVDSRLAQLGRRLQGDGRYPINELFCFASAWQAAMVRLVPAADVVLMDLRGFSVAHLGCVFELNQLVNLVPLKRIVLLADGLTDMCALEETLQGAWRNLHHSAPSAGEQNPVVDLVMLPNLGETTRRFLAGCVVSAAKA